MMQRDYSTGLNEEETFLIDTPKQFGWCRVKNDSSKPCFPPCVCQNPKCTSESRGTSVPRIDDYPETESQCIGLPIEALDDTDSRTDYYELDNESTQEEGREKVCQNRTSKTVFILHFVCNDDTNAILKLGVCLRNYHVDVTLDLFERDNPPNSWPMWYEENIRASEVVLCIITEHFYHRLTRSEHVIGQTVYNLMNDSNTAVRAVFLDTPKKMEHVPPSMQGSTCYCVSSQHLNFEDEEFASLYAFLTGQNRTAKPELGEMVVLPCHQKRQECHPCTREQLEAIYDANLLTNNSSQDSTHMFGSEGGKEADAEIDVDNYRLFRVSSSDSSDDELVAVNSVGYHINDPEYGLWRGSATPGFIDRRMHAPVTSESLHVSRLKPEEQQSNIMQFKQTMFAEKLSGTRLLQSYPDNYQCDPSDDGRLSKSQQSAAIYSYRQTTELAPPPYRDPPPYVLPLRPVKPTLESSDSDLSEYLPCPSGVTYVPQSFYHQGAVHSISSTSLSHLGTQYSGSVQSLQYQNHLSNSQFDVHDARSNMSHYSSFRTSYSLMCSSRQSEFAFFHHRHSSDLSLTSAIAEPADSWNSGSDCSEYLPPFCTDSTYGHQCFQRLSLSRTSLPHHSACHTPSHHHDGPDHLDNDQYSSRRPSETKCPACGSVFPLNYDNQALNVTLPSSRPEVPFVPSVGPLEPSESDPDNVDSTFFKHLPLSAPGDSFMSPQPTNRTTNIPRRRKHRLKCVIM